MRNALICLCAMALAGLSAHGAAAPAAAGARAAQALASVPAWFEPNQGLMDARVKYFAKGAGYRLLLDGTGAEISLPERPRAGVRLTMAGGRANPAVEPLDRLAGTTSYILGRDRGRWRAGVPQYGRVRYREVYPGIDVVFRGAGRELEYDFVVAPGADPSRIRLRFRGADALWIDGEGSLRLTAGGAEIRQPKPLVYQETGAGRVAVAGDYVLRQGGEVRFRLGSYDRALPLVIDPVLVCAGYFGGDKYDVITGMALDPDGSLWLTGTTKSLIDFPAQNEPYQDELVAGSTAVQDAFIAKLRLPPGGKPELLYYSYFGGNGLETGGQIVVDAAGMVYISGATTSFNLPYTAAAVSEQLGGANNINKTANQDIFLAKFNPASATGEGSLLYCTYYGGMGFDAPTALALDAQGRLILAGYGGSIDIEPIVETSLQPGNRGSYDSLVAVIDTNAATAGAALVWNSYWGGDGMDVITGLAADAAGALYITGYTLSADLPIAGDPYQAVLVGSSDVFLAKLDLTKTNLDTLVYGTYIGGSGLDIGQGMRLDASGRLWIAGYSASADFPVTANAAQATYGGGASDAFLMCVDPSKPPEDFIVYSTYLGGGGADVAYDVALLAADKAALTGYTLSNDFPLFAPAPGGHARTAMADAFVSIVDAAIPGVSGLRFSTYFGGTNQDVGVRVAADAAGSVYVAGTTASRNLPVTDGSTKPSPFGSTSSFLLRFDPSPGEQP